MIEYDLAAQKLVIKLVYYGPARSGKTTNLLQLHDRLQQQGRGELMVLDTKDDRTIFFDLLPFFLVAPSGLKIKVKVYTVPGQVRHDSTRKAVLQRADGVAFIADSQLAERVNNVNSFANLEANLAMVGLDIGELPLVIQYNKQDMESIVVEAEARQKWSPTGLPVFMASALQGWGVLETFTQLVRLAYQRLDQKLGLQDQHGLGCDEFTAGIVNPRPEYLQQSQRHCP